MKKIILMSSLLLSSLANAHNIWIEKVPQQQDRYVVKFGHTETESYPQEKLKRVDYLDPQGKLTPAPLQFSAGEAYFSLEQADIVLLEFDNGIWSKLPNGRYVEKNKQQEPTALFSINPVKYGKAILNWTEQAFQSQQQVYELIPLNKPKINEPLAILVQHQGQPVSQVQIGESEDGPFVLTDENGIAQIKVKSGKNRVWVAFQENVNDNPNYEKRSIEYLLTFYGE